jgi:hypothetical protein
MRALFLPLLLLLLAGQALAGENVFSFHSKAESVISSPPAEGELEIICEVPGKVNERKGNGPEEVISFIGIKGSKKPLLAAITPEGRINIDDIPLRLMPQAAVQNFGFIFDRDSDGKIDYIAWNYRPLPVKGTDFPPVFTIADADGAFPVKDDELGYISAHMKEIFRHYADDDGDGKVDAMIIEELDPQRPMVERFMAARCTDMDQAPEECFYFKEKIFRRTGECEKAGEGFSIKGYKPPVQEGPRILAEEQFERATQLLSLINESAKNCGLK